MGAPLKSTLGATVAVLVGLVPAFFVVFNVVFSDVSGVAERLWSIVYVFASYLLLGALLAYFLRLPIGLVTASVSAPAVLILVWYTTHEPQQALFHLGVVVLASSGCYLGAFLVRRLRRPHGASTPPAS